jgi:hypothetical protein
VSRISHLSSLAALALSLLSGCDPYPSWKASITLSGGMSGTYEATANSDGSRIDIDTVASAPFVSSVSFSMKGALKTGTYHCPDLLNGGTSADNGQENGYWQSLCDDYKVGYSTNDIEVKILSVDGNLAHGSAVGIANGITGSGTVEVAAAF